MCGIVGYIGEKEARPVLLGCLGRLEYRGYDSCGIAVLDKAITVRKDTGRVGALAKSLAALPGHSGIGHTRWATHGEPSAVNAHPHADCSGRIAVVHNGVINNFQQLREQLAAEGHTITSQTDTEVIPHLIEKYYAGDFPAAVKRALADLTGAFTMIALMEGQDMLVAARQDSPLVVGVGDREMFLASDVPALLDYTTRVIYLEDGDVAAITPSSVTVENGGGTVARQENEIPWTVEDARKGGYEHFMLKEIHEEPRVIRNTLAEYFTALETASFPVHEGETGREELLLLACGTSYHAGLVGKYLLESLVRVPVRVEHADEFIYSGLAAPGGAAVVLTQSGETIDVIKAARKLKEISCHVTGITNVVGSTISRTADRVIYTRAGPEISVAATKTFVAQLIALYWMALTSARLETGRLAALTAELRQLPVRVQQVLDNEEAIAEAARWLARYDNLFYIGKGINYPVALEGALKLKEISYAHAEGYAAGELKHGPFALLGETTPVVAVMGDDGTYEPMITSLKEIKARRSPVLALVPEGDGMAEELADVAITVPAVEPLFSPVVNSVVLQLLAYYVARERGCPVDFPRNLAKSVTVE